MGMGNLLGIVCCNCNTTPPSCSTTLNLKFFNFDGSQIFCTPPQTIAWTVKGTDNNANSVSLAGTGSTSGSTATLTLSFSGTQLPAGNYTFAFQELAKYCGATTATPSDRFQPTSFSFQVKCPGTNTFNWTTQAGYDLSGALYSFGLQGCGPYTGGTPDWTVNTEATVSGGATECGRTVTPIQDQYNRRTGLYLFVKITGYPYTVKTVGSGQNVLDADCTFIYSACNTSTNDWGSTAPYCLYSKYAIVAYGCGQAGTGGQLAGATVTITGSLTGTGTTAVSDPNHYTDYATLSAWTQPKRGVANAYPAGVSWTVTCDRFNTLTGGSYQKNGQTTVDCPIGGQMTPDADHSCGGCNLPLKKTLQCSTSFGTCTLTWIPSQYSQYGGNWSGQFAGSVPAYDCPSDNTTKATLQGSGALFGVVFSGVTLQGNLKGPGIVPYDSGYKNVPKQCGYAFSETWNVATSAYDGKGSSGSQGCGPFFAHLEGTAIFGYYDDDPSNPTGLRSQYFPFKIDISE